MNKIITVLGIASQIGYPQFHAEAQQKKMNVLFIAVDDLKPELGCYGNRLIKTPNIDRLARNGTVFLSNYCQQAVCGPTRASLLTGKRPDYTKIWDLKTKMRDKVPGILTMPQYFISQDYTTAGIGKIYDPRCVDDDLDKPSWSIPYFKRSAEHFSALTGPPAMAYQLPETKALIKKYNQEGKTKGLQGNKLNDYVQKHVKPSVECADVPDNAYLDGANALHAKEILAKLSKENKPFFFAVGFSKPHLPFVSPKKYWDLYQRDQMPLAEFQQHAKNSPDLAYHNSGELRSYTDIPALCSFTDQQNDIGLANDKQKELIHGYYAAVSYTDEQIGILLNALDSLGLTGNTIIVLWGDHGWHLGDHDLWCKHTNFENATHAPLIISSPGMKANITNSLSEFVDIFPTLCELNGLPVPQKLDGVSLVPVMKHPDVQVKSYAVSQYPRTEKVTRLNTMGFSDGQMMGYSLRTGTYRYTVWCGNSFRSTRPLDAKEIIARELYDYAKDPNETVNVIDSKTYRQVAQDLDRKMMDYLKSQVTQ